MFPTCSPEAEHFVGDLASLTALHVDAPLPHPAVCGDPADDCLLALAVASGAEAIVSGDLDLLSLEQTEPVIVTPRALLERMAAKVAGPPTSPCQRRTVLAARQGSRSLPSTFQPAQVDQYSVGAHMGVGRGAGGRGGVWA